MLQHWTRYFSPYEFNPFDINPLRDRLSAQIDFERLRAHCPLKLFIAATHANSGKLRLFTTRELTLDALLASACLPTIQQAIMIDDEPYWDGGYAANPSVSPLFYHCRAKDILLVLLSPLQHTQTPRNAEDIRERAMEIAFKSNFLQEMNMFAQALRYADDSILPLGRLERRLQSTHFHIIEANALLGRLGTASKLLPHSELLIQLRDAGREHAKQWLTQHYEALGKRSSVNLRALFG
jgi:NTE family protein